MRGMGPPPTLKYPAPNYWWKVANESEKGTKDDGYSRAIYRVGQKLLIGN